MQTKRIRVLEPLHNIVFVRKLFEDETEGGLIIPDAAQTGCEGIVVAAGPGTWQGEKFVETTVMPGDRVLLDRFENNEQTINGEKLAVVRETAILAIVERDAGDDEIAEADVSA